MLASYPASILNQNSTDLEIPNRFGLNSSRFSDHFGHGVVALWLRHYKPCRLAFGEDASNSSARLSWQAGTLRLASGNCLHQHPSPKQRFGNPLRGKKSTQGAGPAGFHSTTYRAHSTVLEPDVRIAARSDYAIRTGAPTKGGDMGGLNESISSDEPINHRLIGRRTSSPCDFDRTNSFAD